MDKRPAKPPTPEEIVQQGTRIMDAGSYGPDGHSEHGFSGWELRTADGKAWRLSEADYLKQLSDRQRGISGAPLTYPWDKIEREVWERAKREGFPAGARNPRQGFVKYLREAVAKRGYNEERAKRSIETRASKLVNRWEAETGSKPD